MNKEILYIVESISNKKSLDKETIFRILEQSLEISIKKKINKNFNINVNFDRNSGEISIFKLLKIVDFVKNKDKEISLSECNKKFPNLYLDDYIKEKIDNFEFNRISSKFAEQIIFSKIKDIEKNILIQNFKKLIGNIFDGIVKKIVNNKIILDIGFEFEAILNNKDTFFNEKYNVGKKIKLVLYDVKYNFYGIQLIVSRSHIFLLYKLIKQNISEINNNLFKIKYIARYPGIKTKIIIESNDFNINNYYINKKYYKILNKISNYLNYENINIILWNNNILKFLENILYPIKANNIVIFENKIDLFIKKEDLFNIIGKNNFNIKLIKKIIDIPINIIKI